MCAQVLQLLTEIILIQEMNIVDDCYKLGFLNGVLKQLHYKSGFSIIRAKLLALKSVVRETKSLRTFVLSQSYTSDKVGNFKRVFIEITIIESLT